jgi:ferredoxin
MKKITFILILTCVVLWTQACANKEDTNTKQDKIVTDTVEQTSCEGSCAGCSGAETCGTGTPKNSDNVQVVTEEERKSFDDSEFESVDGDEFESVDGDEFESVDGDEFESVDGDEFESVDDSEFESVDDSEFESVAGDEFESADETSVQASTTTDVHKIPPMDPGLQLVLIIFAFTILAGILQYFRVSRIMRGVFLVASVGFLGFYRGACPCMISSLQNFIFMLRGHDMIWTSYLWFLGLIPLTYFFGRVWCGWVCHLGALQEILYLPHKLKLLTSQKAQKILKYSRIFFFVLLVAQIFITNSNIYVNIDPFKGIFNLYASSTTMLVLIGILLLSSVFVHRPFCRAACPIGLILGLVARIPGASILKISHQCTGCGRCTKACDNGAIYNIKIYSILNNEDCIRCGKCIDDCKKAGINVKLSKNNKEFKQIAQRKES